MSQDLRKYETVVISRPGLEIGDRKALHQKIQDVLQKHSGTLMEFEVWGKRRLAYPIKKNQKAYYTYYVYAAEGTITAELNSVLRLRDDVLKYMTIKLSDKVDKAELEGEHNIEEFPTEDSHGDETRAEATEEEEICQRKKIKEKIVGKNRPKRKNISKRRDVHFVLIPIW